MRPFDRYTKKEINENDLPNEMDFGRYAFKSSTSTYLEITDSVYPTNKIIRQQLLLEKNRSIQDIFVEISVDLRKSQEDDFQIIPLIGRIKNKVGLNEFENLLYEYVFHLEEIFRQPHNLLRREIEKVHVSRAKRIPSKSYQYLASHTEDWAHKSIVSFVPTRILNEELELNWDVYENRLAVAFIERVMVYLSARLKEVQDIKAFLEDYGKLLKNRDDKNGWHAKIDRNLKLIGAVYEDEHYHGENRGSSVLTKTEETLNQLNKRILVLRKSDLFEEVDKRASQSISMNPTNVLVNHKHYRYLRILWEKLHSDDVMPDRSEEKKQQQEQDILSGVSDYGVSLIAYCLKEYLKYDILGAYYGYLGVHPNYPGVEFKKEANGTLSLKIGCHDISLIVIGNEPCAAKEDSELLVRSQSYVLYYADKTSVPDGRFININPMDADSAERVASLVRKYLLKEYISNIRRKFDYKRILKDYVRYFASDSLLFDSKVFCYEFVSYPKQILRQEDINIRIHEDALFKLIKSRPEREIILQYSKELVEEINVRAEKMKKDFLYCFHCQEKLKSHDITKLDYIKCPHCKAVVDSVRFGRVSVKIDNPRLEHISKEDWGMDYLSIATSDL